VFQEMRGQRQHAAFHFQRGHVLGLKFLGGKIVRLPRIDFGAAGEHIDGGETVFGPGVDRQMRFGDHDNARDAVRIKGVEHHVDNPRFGDFGGFHHYRFDFVHIIQDFGIAVVEFDQEMPTK
jgi:hypothetical protein